MTERAKRQERRWEDMMHAPGMALYQSNNQRSERAFNLFKKFQREFQYWNWLAQFFGKIGLRNKIRHKSNAALSRSNIFFILSFFFLFARSLAQTFFFACARSVFCASLRSERDSGRKVKSVDKRRSNASKIRDVVRKGIKGMGVWVVGVKKGERGWADGKRGRRRVLACLAAMGDDWHSDQQKWHEAPKAYISLSWFVAILFLQKTKMTGLKKHVRTLQGLL